MRVKPAETCWRIGWEEEGGKEYERWVKNLAEQNREGRSTSEGFLRKENSESRLETWEGGWTIQRRDHWRGCPWHTLSLLQASLISRMGSHIFLVSNKNLHDHFRLECDSGILAFWSLSCFPIRKLSIVVPTGRPGKTKFGVNLSFAAKFGGESKQRRNLVWEWVELRWSTTSSLGKIYIYLFDAIKALNVFPSQLWKRVTSYILKGGICGNRIPQTIWNFRRKIVWERKKYQDYTVCRANWRSFPLLMLSHCNKLSIKTLKHTIFSMKIPHWHQILVIFMIYALLSRNFDVRIYALFPQIFGNWKVDSADFFTFRMYDYCIQCILYIAFGILFCSCISSSML